MNLILFGMKSAGKTTLGESLAQQCNLPFFDTDRLIEKKYFSDHQIALTCPIIYQVLGKNRFRNLESQIIQALNLPEKSILALGGGTLEKRENLTTLMNLGVCCYLFVDKQILVNRILDKHSPLLTGESRSQHFFKIYQERAIFYDNCAQYKIDGTHQTIDTLVKISKTLYYKHNGQ